jgi:hypothetical protein
MEDGTSPQRHREYGVAELRYERLNYNISESPLNPPILGDFEVRRPPRIGGLGGEFIPEFRNAENIDQFLCALCGESAF